MTPWRTIQLADRVVDLSPSVIGLNLNPPSVLTDVSWIKPMKYVGIWWGMHINTMTWSSGPKHGATTENTKRYIDFAAANGIGGVLVEGWNVGWDGDWINNRNAFSFTQAYPDYDIKGLAEYAHSKGGEADRAQRDIRRYPELRAPAPSRVRAVPLARIGRDQVRLCDGHHLGRVFAHSQFMVNHYRKVIERRQSIRSCWMCTSRFTIRRERRTYPNMMSREGARGQEYNAWGGEGGNPPEHEANLYFTRLLAGQWISRPASSTFSSSAGTGRPRRIDESSPRTTLAKQLALYIVIYSPLQMAAISRELWRQARLPVHPRRCGGLGTQQDDRRKDRRLRDRRAQGGKTAKTGSSAPSPTRKPVRSMSRCRSSHRARSTWRRYCRRSGGQLGDESASGRDLKAKR